SSRASTKSTPAASPRRICAPPARPPRRRRNDRSRSAVDTTTSAGEGAAESAAEMPRRSRLFSRLLQQRMVRPATAVLEGLALGGGLHEPLGHGFDSREIIRAIAPGRALSPAREKIAVADRIGREKRARDFEARRRRAEENDHAGREREPSLFFRVQQRGAEAREGEGEQKERR